MGHDKFQIGHFIEQPALDETESVQTGVVRKTEGKKLTGIFEARFLTIQNTVAVNYAGVPALALPIPLWGERYPETSIQLIGPPKSEAALLNIGRLVETRN